jgi:beta-glucuronidase
VLSGTIDLDVQAPAGTTAVRYFIDGIQLSELTDLYSSQTKTPPVWSTSTDAGWFEPGPHVLRAEADTPAGLAVTSEPVVTMRPPSPKGITPLNGGWDFAPSADLPDGALDGDAPSAVQPGYGQGTWTSVVVPDSFGAVADKWNDDNGLLVAYRRTVSLSESTTRLRTALTFASCYWSCHYFVNGQAVGTSRGGYLPVHLDVTGAMHPGTNTVAVIVDNRKSTMGVFATVHNYYWNWGGLLQQVQLEQTQQVALTEFRAEAAADGTLAIYPSAVNGTGTDQSVTALLSVTDAHGHPALTPRPITITVPATGEPEPVTVTVPHPQLWDLDHPTLYTVHLQPLADHGNSLTEQTGFRTVSVDGPDLLLNGRPVEDLQGFDRHTDYPGLGRTQPDGLADREIKTLHDKGFRIFRPAHYPTTPAELAAADRYGLLVIEEINVTGFSGASLASADVQAYAKTQLTNEIARDRSHPSVFAFSVGNENRTDQPGARSYIAAVIGLGRQLDPKRLYLQVTLAGIASSSHGLDTTLDLQDFVAQNYYAGAGDGNVYPVLPMIEGLRKLSGNKPVLLSEYGVEAVLGRPGYGVGTEFFQANLIDEHNRLLDNLPHFIGKMYWTSTEFWCTPTWTGGNPQPVPPFHTKALMSYTRQPKLGWKVMFSPVRIWASALNAEPGVRQTLQERIRIEDVRGHGASGTLQVTAPPGYTASVSSEHFHVAPNGVETVDVTLTGTLPPSGQLDPGMVRAVIDSDTEAMPRLLQVQSADATVHPAATDDFGRADLDSNWQVVRPDAAGWSLTAQPGALQLTAEPGTEEGNGTASNLFVRGNTPSVDYTAETHLHAATTADGQDLSLYAYRDDDNFVKVGIAEVNGQRVIRFAQEAAGAINYSDTRQLSADNVWVRLVRRGSSYTADYSYDGSTWYSFTSRRAVAGTVHLALQASSGGAAPITTSVDGLTVLTSGALAATTVSGGSAPLLSGRPSSVNVTLVNGADHDVAANVTLDLPAGWTATPQTATVPAFSTAVVAVPVTPPQLPGTVTATADVTADGVDVTGSASGQLTSVPSGTDVPLALDAGCATSPVLSTYKTLTPDSAWDPTVGFGWVGAAPSCRDRAKLDALRRDFVNAMNPGTLRVNVPAGQHDIYLLVGDPSYAVHDEKITVGGTVVAHSGDVATGQATWVHFPVTGGGPVDLTFTATPGEYWSFDALVVMPGSSGS